MSIRNVGCSCHRDPVNGTICYCDMSAKDKLALLINRIDTRVMERIDCLQLRIELCKVELGLKSVQDDPDQRKEVMGRLIATLARKSELAEFWLTIYEPQV